MSNSSACWLTTLRLVFGPTVAEVQKFETKKKGRGPFKKASQLPTDPLFLKYIDDR